jgi:hypothetical protein
MRSDRVVSDRTFHDASAWAMPLTSCPLLLAHRTRRFKFTISASQPPHPPRAHIPRLFNPPSHRSHLLLPCAHFFFLPLEASSITFSPIPHRRPERVEHSILSSTLFHITTTSQHLSTSAPRFNRSSGTNTPRLGRRSADHGIGSLEAGSSPLARTHRSED